MEKKEPTSLFHYISSAVVDGQLPKDFTLPKLSDDESQISWADGAMDGVSIYHMGSSEMSAEDHGLMVKAVRAAGERDFGRADELFGRLGQTARAISSIDALQSYILDHQHELDAGNIYQYGIHALLDSPDRECVKYGLSLLEMFKTDDNEDLKEVIRTVGLSDEFSIFAVFVMRQWEKGNNEIWQLAKKVHGWGRIHAIEHLRPVSHEMKRWLLLEGVHNEVLPAYSALTCWEKSDAETVLRSPMTREEFCGIRDIINGLLDEGPLLGISKIENSNDMIVTFLVKAKEMASELEDYETIRDIRIHFENKDSNNPEIVALCQEILLTHDCKNAVSEAVKEGQGIGLAQDLDLDYKEDVFALMRSSFESKYYLCGLLLKDQEYKDQVIQLFRQKLPLAEMKAQPTESLGLGREYWRQQALESILQGLRQYPLEGQDFVETALRSAPVRTRNFGISVLEAWTNEKETHLSGLLPEMCELLCRLREIEPNEKTKAAMDRLIADRT